jgi:uncharacterized membrane-anchored protein YjiN (DUF445 family)
MRSLATLLLLLMFVVFLTAHVYEQTHAWPWLPAVKAFAEAALIGAFADWFAVVALFRHPFGIPIPHTAIIPTNRHRIAASVASFVSENFLSPEAVTAKLDSMEPGRIAARWLANEANAERLAGSIASALPPMLRALEDADVDRFLHASLADHLEKTDVPSLLAGALDTVVQVGSQQILFDEALKFSARLVRDNRDYLAKTISRQLHVLRIPVVGDIVCALIADAVVERLNRGIVAVLEDPAHEIRARFDNAAKAVVSSLRHEPETRERVRTFVVDTFNSQFFERGLPPIWCHLRNSVLADLDQENSQIRARLATALLRFGASLVEDARLLAKIDAWTRAFMLEDIVPRRGAVGQFIEQTVLKWPVELMTAKIESQVGRDLQFIRMNGTIVGGLVGLLIYFIFK